MKIILFHILRFFGALFILRKFKGNSVTVLCFHRVSNEHSPAWSPLKIDVFENLIKYISRHYEVITHLDLDKKRSKKPKLILTFDDGYKDFIKNALPVLEKYNMPSVHNIVVECAESGINIWTQRLNRIIEQLYQKKITKISYVVDSLKYEYEISDKSVFQIANTIYLSLLHLSKKERNQHLQSLAITYQMDEKNDLMMDWNDMKKCMDKKVFIGSHSYSHENLTLIKDEVVFEKEILISKKVIEKNLNVSCDVIAMPNGQCNEIVLEKCKQYDYKFIYLLEEKLFRHQSKTDIYLIPRLLIQHESYIENCFKIENFHNILKSLKA